ncbi:hypothetical protein AB0875_12635 [Micromonospora gifhornensis]|uniref:hypothetical protein n=1 Tax=Micromonospora gifhornensis TaxID=84594 RepID=UPI003456F69B
MNEINAQCVDTAVHSHDGGRTLCQHGTKYVERCTFQWARPRVTAYRAADPRTFAVRLNRYPGVVIGAAVQIGRRVFGITWGRPGRRIRIPV